MDTAQIDAIKVIDTDTHILEPYDLWTSRVSVAKYGERVPHVRFDETRQEDVWFAGGASLGVGGAQVAAAGWKESPPKHPASINEISPAIWKPRERLSLMSEYGIHAQVLYPNVPFAGFGTNGDHDFELLLIRAYNDYLTDFATGSDGRFLPMSLLPFWDIDLSIAEAQRCAAAGHRGIIFSQAPEAFGQPRLSDQYWDRLWGALQEMGLPVNFHIATGGDITSPFNMMPPEAGPTAIYAAAPVIFFLGNARTICQLVAGGVCHRFPELQFVSVESGVGWLPFVVNALDWMWKETNVRAEHPEYDLLPSEYFRRQISGCFWFEHGPSLDAAIAVVGADRLLYMTDFPHPTSMSPGPASTAKVPRDFMAEDLGYLDDAVLAKLLHDNAAKLYHLD